MELVQEEPTIEPSLSFIIEANQRLTEAIYKLENLCVIDDSCNNSENHPSLDSVIILGRKLSPSTIPPMFIKFNSESGPLEPMPSRFHVPFPTIEDMRFSILNVKQPAFTIPAVTVPLVAAVPLKMEEDEEYADDF